MSKIAGACVALVLSAGSGAAQSYVQCSLLDENLPPDIARAATYEAEISNGFVRSVRMTHMQGQPTLTQLRPIRQGMSVRTMLIGAPFTSTAVTNIVTFDA